MADDAIERRLRRVEDVAAIDAVFQDYRRALDGKDFRAYAALFARDGVFEAADMRAVGPDAIYELVAGMTGTLLTERTGDDYHVVANVTIEVDGDRATATSTWMYVVRAEGDVPELAKIGHYEDQLVREDGAWRFALRRAPTDIPAV